MGFSQVFITGSRAGAFFKQDLESLCRKPQMLKGQAEPESQGTLMGGAAPLSPAGGSWEDQLEH